MKDQKTAKESSARPGHSLPWWIFVLLAVGSYCTLKYLLPDLHSVNPTLQKLFQAAPTFAPLITIVFLLLAAKRLYDTDRGKKDMDHSDEAKE